MTALAGELANHSQSAEARAQAGLQLKQCLQSKDDAINQSYHDNWLALDEATRGNIKSAVRHSHFVRFIKINESFVRATRSFPLLVPSIQGPQSLHRSVIYHDQARFNSHLSLKVIAAIACIEIPQGLWLDVIPTLLVALTSEQAAESHKVASLETVGYICEGVVCALW